MDLSDFLCDFCGRAWDGTFPMVEGHQGALICDRCLTVACGALLGGAGGVDGGSCTLCLEARDQTGWRSPVRESAWACLRCVNQAAVRLERDPDWAWARPAAARGRPKGGPAGAQGPSVS